MKKKGILLVTTLIFLGVIIMLCSVIAYNGKSVLMSGSGYADSEQAYMAAMSGIDFIREQLAENKNYGKPDFFSGENKKNGQSDSDANEDKDVCFLNYQDIFKVGVNKRKNLIIGCLAPSLSVDKTAFKTISALRDINSIDSRAKFIISFDSQNDYLSPRSINNFDNEAPQEADLNGNKSEVPPNTFYVVSTGICGRYRKKAVVLLASNGPAPLRGGTTAKNDITISSSAFNISHVSPKTDADIIALNDFNINDFNTLKNKDNNSIKISSDSLSENGKKITANNVEKKLPANVRHNSNPSIDEADLSGLNSLDKALEDSKISPNSSLKSGTYIYIRDVTDLSSELNKARTFTLADENGAISLRDKNKWVYLDEDYADIDWNKVNNYSAVQSVNGVSFGNGKVTVSENVATDGNIHFMALNKTEDGYSNGNSIDFELDDGSLIVGKSSSDDKNSLIVDGEVTGTGKLFATGDINMNAGSVFEARKQSGVGIWAGGCINVKNAENLSSDSAVQEHVLLKAGIEHAVENGLEAENTLISTANGSYHYTELENAYSAASDDPCVQFKLNGETITLHLGSKGSDDGFINIYKGDQFVKSITPSSLLQQLGYEVETNNGSIYGRTCWSKLKNGNDNSASSYVVQYTPENKTDYPNTFERVSDATIEADLATEALDIKIKSHVTNSTEKERGELYEGFPGAVQLIIEGESIGIIDINNAELSVFRDDLTKYVNYEHLKVRDRYRNSGTKDVDFVESTNGKILFSKKNLAQLSNVGYTQLSGTDIEIQQGNISCVAYLFPSIKPDDFFKIIRAGEFFVNDKIPKLNKDIEYPDILPGDSIESYLKRFYAFNVNNTSFKGTIYSVGNHIAIQTNYRDFELLGAFIAINGSILLSHINNGSLIFDPDYVPFFKNENYGVDTRILYLSVL